MLDSLSSGLQKLFEGLGRRTSMSEQALDEALGEFRAALLEADVSLKAVRELAGGIRDAAVQAGIRDNPRPGPLLQKIVGERLREALGGSAQAFQVAQGDAAGIVLLAGTPGSGKTATAVKLARWLTDAGTPAAVATTDTARLAASEQLQAGAQDGGVPFVQLPQSELSPARLARTLGRLTKDHRALVLDTPAVQTREDKPDTAVLEQLCKALRPRHCLLVADSLAGQGAARSASAMAAALPLTGVVLTRLDSDAKGGAVLSVRHATGLPVFFSGTGERPQDLEVMDPARMVGRILGEGDLQSLAEQVQKSAAQSPKLQRAAKRLQTGGALSMEDVGEQLRQMRKLGGMESLAAKLPGAMAKAAARDTRMNPEAIKRMLAAIDSMTPLERARPHIINPSRKKRICRGAGILPRDLNQALKMHSQLATASKRMAKLKKRAGGQLPQLPGGGLDPSALGGDSGFGLR